MKKNFTVRLFFLYVLAWGLSVSVGYAQTAIPTGSFTATCATAGNINWDNSVVTGGNVEVVFVKAGSAITATPPTANISTYTANIDVTAGTAYQFDAAAHCVYKGTGGTVGITNMTAGTTYFFLIFNTDGTATYSSGLTFSSTLNYVPSDVTALAAAPGSGQSVVSWTNPNPLLSCFDEVLIVGSTASVTGAPSGDGTAYTGNVTFGTGGATAFGGGFVVYKGSTSSQTILGLTDGLTYFFKTWVRKGTAWSAGVQTSVILPPDPVTPVSFTATCVDAGTVSWTNPTAVYNVVVFAKATSAVTTTGTLTKNAGTFYTANTVFPSGTAFELDAAAHCIYNGTGTSVNITGLTAGTTYNFVVYNANATNYSTAAIISPAATFATPANATGLGTTPSSGQVILGWTNPTSCVDEVVVVASETSAVAGVPTGDGTAYTAAAAYASGTPFGGGYVVYKGTGTMVTVTNLANCTLANFSIFTRKGTTWSSGAATSDTPVAAPSISSLGPLNTATNVATNTTLTLTFSQNVTLSATVGAASETAFTITENGSPFQTLDRSSPNIAIAGNVVTVTINALNLSNPTLKTYDVVVGGKVFSACGLDFVGITTGNWDFSSSPGVTITAPTAGVCQNVYTALGDIVLHETAVNNFQGSPSSGLSLVLRFDVTGFAFQSGTSGVSVQVAGGGDISSATPASVNFSAATMTINFPAGNAQNQPDMITIKGLEITSDGSNPTAHVVMDASSTLSIQGVTPGTTVLGTVNTGATPAAPTLTGFSSGTGSYCQGTNISAITVTVTGSGIKWFSDIGLTNVVFSGNPANISSDLGVNSATPGTTTFYAAQTSTCLSPGLAVPVTIFPSPGATAGTFGATQCSGNQITLGGSPTISTPSTPPYTYAWTELTGNYTGGPISAISNPQVTITNTSGSTLNYQFKVIITDNNLCTATSTNSFNVFNQAVPNLTQPGSTFLSPHTPPQTLTSNFTTISFTGIGVVQTSASVYKFIASQAYDSLQPLPQQFQIYFNGTDPNGCPINNYNIATITLSNNTFTFLQNQYCSAEKPYGGTLPGGGVDLTLSGPSAANVASYVSSWNTSQRFNYENYSIFQWSGASVSYQVNDLVYYGGEIYRANFANVSNPFLPPPFIPGTWSSGAFEVTYSGMIRNYYEGYYGGNNGQPTINKSGAIYYMYTNPNYNNCPTCSYEYPAAYAEFTNFNDIRYYIGNYHPFYNYYVGDLAVSGGHIYQCIQSVSAGTFPPPNGTYWTDVTSTGFDVGYAFYDPSTSTSGYYTYGQFVQINRNPTVSFTGLTDGQNVCQGDISGAANVFDLTSNLQTGGVTNAGTFQISFDNGTTWVSDASSSNAITNIGINSGRATFNSQNAWTEISTVVSGGSYSWSSSNTYSIGDNVFYLSKFYRSKTNNNSGNAPSSDPADWEANALKVDVRLYYDPGTTGSTPGSPGSVGDVCDGVYAIKVYLNQSPTIAFAPGISLQTFCNGDAPVALSTNRTSGVLLSGYGVTSNSAGNGTGIFTPATAFSQSVSAGGTSTSPQEIILTATYTDPHGCQNFVQSTPGNTYVVNPPPPASFTITTSTQTYNITTVSPSIIIPFCYNDGAAAVSGPQGLAWFDVIYQGVTIAHTYPTGHLGSPGPSFSFLPSQFFNDAATNYGANPLNTISFQVNYTSYDSKPCTTQIQSVTFSVAPSLQVNITGVTNHAVFCSNEGSLTLKFSPFQSSGTSFSINGTPFGIGSPAGSDTYSYPLNSNLGQVIFSYNIQSGNGNLCNNPAGDTIQVLKSPIASFHVAPKCDSAVVQFQGADISNNTGVNPHYTWTFTDNPPGTSTQQNTSYQWNVVGNYNVHLDLRYDPDPLYNNKVCVANNTSTNPTNDANIDHTQVIGPIPTVDFNFSNVCNGDPTDFAANQTNGVTQYRWLFGDAANDTTGFGISSSNILANTLGTTGTYQNPIHNYPVGANTLVTQVTVIGRTDSTTGACLNSMTRQVAILQKLPIDSVHFYDMSSVNGGDGYWVVEDRGGNSNWTFSSVTPGGAIPAAGAWNNIFYKSSDQSYVNSPCFDMSGYSRPAISLQYFMDGRPQQDGAVLQYSTDIAAGVQQWVVVGNIGSGQDWYTTQGISGKPGDPFNPTFYGWSDAGDTQWSDSKNALDVIAALPLAKRQKVRFRIAFGSDLGSTNGARGFAFNNVTIVNRNRLSLIENFTNDNIGSAATNNADFQSFQSGNSEVVKLEYHVGLPSPDAINTQSPTYANSRGAFYGLTNTASLLPRAYLDGTSDGDFTTGWLNNAYTLRSLKASPMTIKIKTDTATTGGVLVTKVSAAAVPSQNITTGNLRFYLVTLEKVVGSDKYIVRKIFPDAAGSAIAVPFNTTDTDSLKINPWTIGSQEIGNISQIALAAFVQDIDTKEVLQAAYLSNPLPPAVITGIEPIISDLIATYPVPSDREFVIELPQPAVQAIEVRLVNQLGQPAAQSSFAEGEQKKSVNTEQLADGVYILQLGNNGSVARMKVMVIHK